MSLNFLRARTFIFSCYLLVVAVLYGKGVRAQDPGVTKIYCNRLTGSSLVAGASVDLTYTKDASQLDSVIINIVRLSVKEESSTYISQDFTATVPVTIYFGPSSTSVDSINQTLVVNYKVGAGASYSAKNYLSFKGAAYINVKVGNISTAPSVLAHGVDPKTVLVLENEMQVKRYYELLSSTFLPSKFEASPLSSSTPDVLPVSWEWPSGAGNNRTQLEWTWIENELAGFYKKTDGSLDTNLMFRNNATRVELPLDAVDYQIPLLYDGAGTLFYRIRAINIKASGSMSLTKWSTQSYSFTGHDSSLNWQASTAYAEDGKRKSVMQYYDGSLRMRQTVTKDNTTNTIVTAETFYDGQGRPAVQILPAPGMSTIVAYTKDLNKFNGQTDNSVDPAIFFDLQAISGGNSATPSMSTDSGAAKYYSASNPTLADNASDQNLPDAEGYPYSVTRYTPDATGRIMSQSSVGAALKMGSGHETKYYYDNAAQEELDALFGTDAGVFTHYFKNMVQDANGQMSVSYVDMHGRTVATALAGDAPSGMVGLDPDEVNYPGQSGDSLDRNLLRDESNVVRGNSIESLTSIAVSANTIYNFTYALTPAALKLANCKATDSLCYGCKYDLEISITDESGDQDPIVRRFSNVSLAGGDTCGSPLIDLHYQGNVSIVAGNIITFADTLAAGSYSIRKTLTINDSTFQAYEAKFLQEGMCDTLQSLIDSVYQALLPGSDCGVTDTVSACQSCLASLGSFATFKAAYIANMGSDYPSDSALRVIYSSDSAHCTLMCSSSSSSNSLEAIRSLMLSDMVPYTGQYAQDPSTGNSNIAYQRYDIFGPMSTAYRKPWNANKVLDYYYDGGGNIDATIQPDSSNRYQLLNTISPARFDTLFQSTWASALLPHHPEYDKLVYAEKNLVGTYNWIDNFVQVDTWAAAVSGGYSTDSGYSQNRDSFFLSLGSAYKATMANYVDSGKYYGGMSLWQLAYGQTVCNTYTDSLTRTSCYLNSPLRPPYNSLSTANKDAIWNNFKVLYKSVRDSLVNVYLQSASPVPDASLLVSSGYTLRFPYTNSQIATQYAISWLTASASTVATLATDSAASYTGTECSSYIDQWKLALSQCPSLAGRSDSLAILNEIVSGMVKVCQYGQDDANPQGSSNVAPSTPVGYYTDTALGSISSPRSFEDVVTSVFAKYHIDTSQYCSPYVISFPKPYGENPQETKQLIAVLDSCNCHQFTAVKDSAVKLGYDTTSLSSMNLYLKSSGLDTLTQVLFDGLGHCSELGPKTYYSYTDYTDSASAQCAHPQKIISKAPGGYDSVYRCYDTTYSAINYINLSAVQSKPDFLYCGFTPSSSCLTCAKLSALVASYKAYFGSDPCAGAPVLASGDSMTAAQISYNETFAAYLNYKTGNSYSWLDYIKAANAAGCSLSNYASNSNASQTVICRDTTALNDTTGMLVSISPCQRVYDQALALAESIFEQRQKVLLANFEAAYKAKCLAASRIEQFSVKYVEKEFHYTLYYYDMAGNLERTVPPKGVRPIFRKSFTDSVDSARVHSIILRPEHQLVTTYRYNSLNEVVSQTTPDAGTSYFWYDKLGRLAVSQNSRQVGEGNFSYTVYDSLGRITQVGQKPQSTAMTQVISQNPGSLYSWLNTPEGVKNQITTTVYDVPVGYGTGGLLAQSNLRNRVSYTNYSKKDDGTWYAATYYDYDVHGNVDTLVQDYYGITGNDGPNQYKLIAYDYDLISGKVNGVDYQPGKSDAFYHRYRYDAENRIVSVYTSRDSLVWERDAAYKYYKHGPLSRTVLGGLQVQGLDYSYTLQGWLKGVNLGTSGSVSETAVDDAVVDTRAITGGPVTYTARSSIDFVSGFEVVDGDAFQTVIDTSLGICTTGAGSGTDVTTATEYYPVSRDAYSYSLHYFPGDYQPVGSTTSPAGILQSLPSGEAAPLYNGNIAAMAVNVSALKKALVYNYHYDQLNRIRKMDAYGGWDTVSQTFNPIKLDDYQERVSYDPNGNILGYLRNGSGVSTGGSVLAMDSLNYGYYAGTNRLKHISDGVTASNYSTDIDNQSTDANYTYDSIGNLKTDVASGITNITWTVYGKIDSITNSSGTIHYTYDAAGNRITKTAGGVTWIYVRDAQGNVMSVYKDSAGYKQTEVDLYGSSRLGMTGVLTTAPSSITLPGGGSALLSTFTRAEKSYELSNHLGNVLATITDKKIGVSSASDSSLIDHYVADVATAQDYYPFGMLMPGRSYNAATAGNYRYGFNGKENDDEVKGKADQIDYGNRMYDPRLGRFLSVDPLQKKFPYYTPYQFAGNTPMQAVDMDGLEPKGYAPGMVDLYKDLSVRQIPSRYDNQAMQGTIGDYSGIISATAVQDIDKKTYVVYESVHGERQWYVEYDNDGWKGNVNEFKWNKPVAVGKDIYWLVAPIILLPALPVISAGAPAVSNIAINAGAQLYPLIPLIGVVGRNVAGVLDESGGVGMQNAALSRVENYTASQIENFVTTEEGALFQVDKFKQIIKDGGKEFERLMQDPIEAVAYNGKTFVLDGHNRLKAFSEVGKDVNVTILSVEEATKKYKDKMVDIVNGNFNTVLRDEH